MKKEIRCFIIDTSYVLPDTHLVSELFELSEYSRTFARRKEERKLVGDDNNIVISFHHEDDNHLTDDDMKVILGIVRDFSDLATASSSERKDVLITSFIRKYNEGKRKPLRSFNYNTLISHPTGRFPDYLTFDNDELNCSVWLSDETFRLFYPLYDIVPVTPFEEFGTVVKNGREMTSKLSMANTPALLDRMNEALGGYPCTVTRILNIPYYQSKESAPVDCNFGFNIWGLQGNYDHILKEILLDYFKNELGLDDEFIEEHFPDVYKINEFFMIPMWDSYAIPAITGQGSVNSQITYSYPRTVDVLPFLTVYKAEEDHVRNHTRDVPFAFNNILVKIVDGKYTDIDVRNFTKVYPDLLTVPVTHPDFARMHQDTQKFVIMMSYFFAIANSGSQTEVFNKIMVNKEYKFALGQRGGTPYVTVMFGSHRYYILPRYVHKSISGGK